MIPYLYLILIAHIDKLLIHSIWLYWYCLIWFSNMDITRCDSCSCWNLMLSLRIDWPASKACTVAVASETTGLPLEVTIATWDSTTTLENLNADDSQAIINWYNLTITYPRQMFGFWLNVCCTLTSVFLFHYQLLSFWPSGCDGLTQPPRQPWNITRVWLIDSNGLAEMQQTQKHPKIHTTENL